MAYHLPYKINFYAIKNIGTKTNTFKSIGTKWYTSFDKGLFPILHKISETKNIFFPILFSEKS